MKDQSFTLIWLYLTFAVVIVFLAAVVRNSFWSVSTLSIGEKREYVYGLLYARQIGLLGCLGGIFATIIFSGLDLPPSYSLYAIPLFPILYIFTYTKRERWKAFFGT